jgi:two-component system, response regulator YesN
MYQALVVDDEKEIREGISSWEWKGLNVHVVGCCANGLEALKFISSNPVDVVITDIRMPFMTGLELMEELNRQYPFIHTILLSGYSEFEYARKGIQMGAVDYLLKPITYTDMAITLQKLTAMLDEQNQMQYRLSVLKRKSQQLAKAIRSEFLDYMFQSPLSQHEIEYNGAEGELLLNTQAYTAAIIRLDRASMNRQSLSNKELDLYVFSLDIILNKIWDGEGYGYHLVNSDTASVYLLSKGIPQQERFDILMRNLLKYKGLYRSTFSIVVGPMVDSPINIFKSMNAARMQLPSCKENSIVFCPPIEAQKGCADVKPHKPDAQTNCIEPVRPNNPILAKARKYIQDNYNRSITLKEVASNVFVSPGYLSSLFKDCNEPFLKYLTSHRIQKAKELMDDPKYKIYDIVEMVGYSDPAYFSEVFKKLTGKTPNEYRGHIKPGNDS